MSAFGALFVRPHNASVIFPISETDVFIFLFKSQAAGHVLKMFLNYEIITAGCSFKLVFYEKGRTFRADLGEYGQVWVGLGGSGQP